MKGLRLCLLLHRRDTDVLPTRYSNKKTPPKGGVFFESQLGQSS